MDVKKRLANQVKNAFIACLLILWVPARNAIKPTEPVHSPWYYWLIAALLVFGIIFRQFHKANRKTLRWVMPVLAVAMLGGMYYISTLKLPELSFTVLAIVLLGWTLFLFVMLLSLRRKIQKQGKIYKFISNFTNNIGEIVAWPLTSLVLIVGVISGWQRLVEADLHHWWVYGLLIWGIIIWLVVSWSTRPEAQPERK